MGDKEVWLPSCSENLKRAMTKSEIREVTHGGGSVPSRRRGKGTVSAILALWGVREQGKGREETAPQTLTPISHPTRVTSLRIGRGASGGSAGCHSAGPLSGTGVSNKGSFGLASSRRMFTRRSDEKLSPNAVL